MKNDLFTYHQKRIARQTLKLSDIGAFILGGMTKDEARMILKNEPSDDLNIDEMQYNQKNSLGISPDGRIST